MAAQFVGPSDRIDTKSGHMLCVLAFEVKGDEYLPFSAELHDLFDRHNVTTRADQSSGDNLDVVTAVDAFARYVRERA